MSEETSTLPDIMLELPPEEPAQLEILTVEQAVSPEDCRFICDYMNTEYLKNPSVSNPQRTAFCVPIASSLKPLLHEILHTLLTRHVEPRFNKTVEWWESPQLLRYVDGGEYRAHSDSENPSKDPQNPGWVKTHDRDISMLIYLNDDFTGGQLSFPNHRYTVDPKPGLMVAFPSHHGYRHAAEPTQSGVRHVMASWVATKGSQRVRPEPPGRVVFKGSYPDIALP